MLRNLFLLLVAIVKVTHSFSDIGKWDLPMNGDNCLFTLAKSLFQNSELIIMLKCDVANTTNLTVSYSWAKTICSPNYLHYFEQQQVVACSTRVEKPLIDNGTAPLQVIKEETKSYTCHDNKIIVMKDENAPDVTKDPNAVIFHFTTFRQTVSAALHGPASWIEFFLLYLASFGDASVTYRNSLRDYPKSSRHALLTVDKEGIYLLKMTVSSKVSFRATASVEMVSPSGYLSVAIWPLLPFFGVMCGVYTLLCTGWLLVCWLQWRDLLRIQYWIGGVALLGMVESATYYGVYSNINSTGYFNPEVYMFAEWISVAKRALARMLVIIVSLGFGIVKPRLGPALQRVVGTGVLWGVLGGINAWLRLHHKANDSNRDLLLSEVPLSLLDSAICWWVFVSLAHTMRTLQLRRNTIKLSLYRHFTNTLIFAVISSVVFMLYSIKSYRVLQCITEWKEVWMDEAYWHILFASVLTVIMVLWRPTNNNQRYAFTPLLDNAEDDEEEEEQFVNDAYGVKMRGTNSNSDGLDGRDPEPNTNSLDSDLRWVEENIPTSTLPLLDSDEEIINTKFEVSKMQ